jgi:hypothetical protein
LLGITTVYNLTEGAGTDDHPIDQQDFFTTAAPPTSYNGTFAPQSSAQGSAAIQVEVIPTFRSFPQTVASTTYFFYAELNASMANLIARILSLFSVTVLDFPDFRPESITLVLKGQQVSLKQSADSRSTFAIGGPEVTGSRIWGSGTSIEFGTSVRTKELAPVIHDDITIGDASDTATATVDVDASIPEFDGALLFDTSIDNDPDEATATVTASVEPSSLTKTDGDEVVPSTGKYIVELNYGPQISTRQYVGVTVVNFAEFA